jgi:hypothetical protein
MSTIDSLLPLIASNIKTVEHVIPKKDKRILLSMAKQLTVGVFLTENQGNLLIKIIKENITPMTTVIPDVENTIEEPTWSKSFREVNRFKKIFISSEFPNSFVVEFSFNTRLRDKISQANQRLRGNILSLGSKYVITLTEENLSLIADLFQNDGFDVDPKISDFLQEIEEIKKNTKNPFDIFDLKSEKVKSAVEQELRIDDLTNLRLLQDRKIRYQYKNHQKIPEFSLEDQIANREGRKIFIHSEQTGFTQVVDALKKLNRLPAMLIFEGHNSVKDKKYLKLVENAVKELGIGNDIGIYFRYNKENDKEEFNHTISSLGYNKDLTGATAIAGISNNKIPKFMIKSGWKPQTVISFTSSFKSNKSYVYCSDVDLIIYYGNSQPLDEEVNAIL